MIIFWFVLRYNLAIKKICFSLPMVFWREKVISCGFFFLNNRLLLKHALHMREWFLQQQWLIQGYSLANGVCESSTMSKPRCRFLMFCSFFHLNWLLLCLPFLAETFLQNLTTVNYFIYMSLLRVMALCTLLCIYKKVFLYSISIKYGWSNL